MEVCVTVADEPEEQNEGSPNESNGASDAPEAAQPESDSGDQQKRLKDQLLRTAADFENFRKRAKRDAEDAERRGMESVLREILPVVDNLERATLAAEDATSLEAVSTGVKMVLKQFQDVAGRISLERVESVGARFDPALHDAVQQQETDEHPPGSIIQEVVPGYRLKDKLLRPALVVVARPARKEESPSTPPGETTDVSPALDDAGEEDSADS